jgi:hypothetical protein
MVIGELEERKLYREQAAARIIAKEAEKEQKQKIKNAEKDHQQQQREQEMHIAAVQHSDAKRDAYIAKLEASIEKFAKQQLRCFRKTLHCLELEKLASLSSNPFTLPTRTPYKSVHDNTPTYHLNMKGLEVDTPILCDQPTVAKNLELLASRDASGIENQSLASLLAIVAGDSFSSIDSLNQASQPQRSHYIPRHKKARSENILSPPDDSSIGSELQTRCLQKIWESLLDMRMLLMKMRASLLYF